MRTTLAGTRPLGKFDQAPGARCWEVIPLTVVLIGGYTPTMQVIRMEASKRAN